jgi:hypothetical protein
LTPHDNSPLSERAEQAIRDGEAAWERVSSGDWDASAWWIMGTALTLIRAQVLHETGINKARGNPYNEAFKLRLASTKFATMDSVTRSNLLYLMEPEIRVVLDRLLLSWKPDIRARRTHPTTLAQYVRSELKPKQPTPVAPKAKAEPRADTARRESDELSKLKLENNRLREQLAEVVRQLAQAQAFHDESQWRATEPGEEPKKNRHARKDIRDRVRELEALVLPLDDEGKDAVRQHKRKVNRDFKRQWRVSEEAIKKRHWIVDERTYALLLAGYHPDVEESRKYRDQARAILEGRRARADQKGRSQVAAEMMIFYAPSRGGSGGRIPMSIARSRKCSRDIPLRTTASS